jgi:hypothetical protein
MEEISVHDNFVKSYSVDADKREIILHTVYRGGGANESTDIVFSDVAAYRLTGDNFQTILFDVTETSLEQVLEMDRSVFAAEKNYAWPIHYQTESDLLENMSGQGMRAFLVHSSYGMGGWVWAKSMNKVTNTK